MRRPLRRSTTDARAGDRRPRYYSEIEVRRGLVADLVRPLAPARIVDLGCGEGTLSVQFATEATRIVLVDSSDEALKQAEHRVPTSLRDRVSFVLADFPAFDGGGTYDMVLCVGLLAHLPDVDAALAAVADLVGPEGAALIQITDAGTPAGLLLHAVGRVRERRRGYRFPLTTQHSVVKRMSSLGLELEESRCYLPSYSALTARLLSFLNIAAPRTSPPYIGGDRMLLFGRHRSEG